MRLELMGYLVKGFGGDVLLAHRCWWKYIFYIHKNGREDSQNLRATSRLRMYKIGKRFGVGIFVGDIFWGRYFIGAALLVVL